MSAKHKRPGLLDRVVTRRDLLAFNEAWLRRMRSVEAEVQRLRELVEKNAKAD